MTKSFCATALPDKGEADSITFEAIKHYNNFAEITPAVTVNNTHTVGQVFKIWGASFHQSQSFHHDIYYMAHENGMAYAIDDPRYPLETMNNLMLGAIPSVNRNVILNHHAYGGVINTVSLPFDKLITTLSQGNEVYCATTSIDTTQVSGYVVFYNIGLNSIHLLEIEAPLEVIQKKTGNITAHLYSNIPQANIADLFATEPEEITTK